MAELLVVGASHRSADSALRDRLFVREGDVAGFLADLRARGVRQALVLSTCDRVEVHAGDPAPDRAAGAIAAALAAHGGVADGELAPALRRLDGVDALRHVFEVASSLDSVVVGEPQVLGQLKEAHRLARAAGIVGSELEGALQAAYACAKRVRSETAIAIGPVSLAATAVQVARDLHGDLASARALLIGGGDVGALLVDQFRLAGIGQLTVAAPSAARAAIAARRHGSAAVTFDQLGAALADADIVVAAAGTGRWLVDRAAVERALRQRHQRPIFLIDAGLPGDIEPAVDSLENAFRYDLDDLDRVARASRAGRAEAAAAGARIVDECIDLWSDDRAARAAVPLLAALRGHFEAARRDVLARAGQADAAEATRLLVNRLLHEPYAGLRAAAASGMEPEAMAAMVKRLFPLDAADADDDGENGR
ncbi:MAG: glutamyl-tRNA reductase [Alphaproteobacteria bacterium]